jgi:hypothetical protein
MLLQQLSLVGPQLLRPAPEPTQLAPVVVELAHAPLLHIPVAHFHAVFH